MRFELVGAAFGLVAMAIGDYPVHSAGVSAFIEARERLEHAGSLPSTADAWFLGGTLHDVDASVWMAAEPLDQLATAADWALAFPKIEAVVAASGNVDTLLPFARALHACVTQSAAQEVTSGRTTTTAELAAVCGVQLKWVTPES